MTDRNRWIALYVLCAGMLMIVLDVTVVNVALPSIQNDLGFSQSSLAWVVNAYLIAFGGLLLLAGRFGDLLGRKRVFLAGLAVFTRRLAALRPGARARACWSRARFVQGVGGAMTSAVILGMIVTMFPEPREQAKAIGVYGFVASAGGSVGLLAGGVLTQSINWHWIFFVNVPIGIATGVLATRLLERDEGIGFGDGRRHPRRGADHQLADARRLHDRQARGRGRLGLGPRRSALGAVSLALLAAFVVREAHGAQPADPAADLPLAQRLGRQRGPGAARSPACSACSSSASLYLQRVLGYDALQIGLAFLPATLVMGTLSLRYSERLIMRFGAATTLLPGLVLIARRAAAVRAGAGGRQLRGATSCR